MSEVQFTLPPVLAGYLKEAVEAQGTSLASVVRSTSSHIEAGKATPTSNGRDKRCALGLPSDMARWYNEQSAGPTVIWLSCLSTLTNDVHEVFASSLLAMVGLRLLPGGETEGNNVVRSYGLLIWGKAWTIGFTPFLLKHAPVV